MGHTSLASVLLAALLFASNVFAVSAVLGIDLGTEYIKAALVKPGIPLEIVLTKDSRRKEISAVTFKPAPGGPKPDSYPERLYGSDAMALAPRFPGDAYPNLKALLGKSVDSAIVREYSARHPALQLKPNGVRGTAAFKSKAFTEDTEPWMVEELLAMQLQSIQKNAENMAGPGTSVQSVVLTIPPFYTTEEKRAVELAAELAGLKVLSLISDGLAVGLNYATSRKFPNVKEGGKPELHMVFDMGAGSTKTTIMKFQSRSVKDTGKFNKTVQEVQVLGSGWDRTLGGDDLNALIIDDMVSQFVETSAAKKAGVTVEAVKAHGRAVAKLSKEAERLRHVLSANTNTQASFEGLYEDIDFKYKISRADFEKMAEDRAGRVATAVRSALEMAGKDISELDSIILHGGTSRTPFVQKQLEELIGNAEKIRTNVNSDEAAVFGAGFRAAELSPSFRVKEIRIFDAAGYNMGIKYLDGNEKEKSQGIWYPTSSLGAAPKEVAFDNREDFSVTFFQDFQDAETLASNTKVLTTKNLTASVAELKDKYSCTDESITLKATMRLMAENGEVHVTKVAVQCEAEEPEAEGFVDGVKNLFGFGGKAKDQKVLKDDENAEVSSESAEGAEANTSSEETTSTTTTDAAASESAEPKEKPKKLITINVGFTLEKDGVPSLSKSDMSNLKNRLRAFANSDKARQLREAALNELEGYTYKVRDFLDTESFIGASTEEERAELEKKSRETSDWLYEDGTDAPQGELKKKLKELQDIVDPILARGFEAAERPALVDGLRDALKQSAEFVANIKEKINERAAWEAEQEAKSSVEAAASEVSTTTTAAPKAEESGEFAGLEDDEPAATTTVTEEDVMADRGPVPPLYTLEDLEELEGLTQTISKWLEDLVAQQAALPATTDPVLLVKDLKAKREHLDKMGMELAMKSVRNFEKKQKAKSKTESSTKTKKAKATKKQETEEAKKSGEGIRIENEEGYIKLNPDGKMPTDEELEAILKMAQEKAEGKKEQEVKKEGGHDEL